VIWRRTAPGYLSGVAWISIRLTKHHVSTMKCGVTEENVGGIIHSADLSTTADMDTGGMIPVIIRVRICSLSFSAFHVKAVTSLDPEYRYSSSEGLALKYLSNLRGRSLGRDKSHLVAPLFTC